MRNNLISFRKLFILFCLSIQFSRVLVAQKHLIDSGAEKNWPTITRFGVSNNGGYFWYTVGDQSGSTLAIEPTSLKWKIVIPRAEIGIITQNNKKLLFQQSDSIGIVDLNDDHQVQYIKEVDKFSLIKEGDAGDLLLYELKQSPDELIIRDMEKGKEKRLHGVLNYWMSPDGKTLVFENLRIDGAFQTNSLNWLDISDDTLRSMWEGRSITSLSMDEEGMQCVFAATDAGDSNRTAIWRYQRGERAAIKIIDDYSDGMERGFRIKDILAFNGKDSRVFFNLEKINDREIPLKSVPVDIWSYKDATLQSAQLYDLPSKSNSIIYKAVLNIPERKVIRLEYDDERIVSVFYTDKQMTFLLGIKTKGGDVNNEWNWNRKGLISVYLISLKDGIRRFIDSNLISTVAQNYALSYNENYIVYYDAKSRNYCSYCLKNKKTRNLTYFLHANWTNYERSDEPDSSHLLYNIAGLFKNEDDVLVYDRHDIYELDPAGKVPAVNLTKTCGSPGDLEIRLTPWDSEPLVARQQKVICTVFNRKNKNSGIACLSIDSLKYIKGFKLLPCYFDNIIPRRARDTNVNFVVRMTAEEAPNIYLTCDFTTYKPVTDLNPEKRYNWMRAELVTWRTFDGTLSQGVLYKPENLDLNKKYPLLVYIYERLSDNLYKFLQPGLSNGRLNIPFYVSNGYLVFIPDIHYKIGWPGKSAYNSVVSGVNFLSRRKYVDARRIGLQGHSFGGFETNYIITHSHLFAAAMSSSGMADFVSAYGSIIGNGTSRQRQYELYRDRIGATLWQRPTLYMENSPVLRADKVTTPLLMMANKEDNDVPFQQGIEFFTALRRLEKKAWMLQYDGKGHNVDGKAADDLTIRMFQFFNYYLKGEPPPKWMTRGVSAEFKRIDDGLDLDASGEKP
jgi:dienelactone hydrolase